MESKGVARGHGEQEVGLECMGVVSRCCCKEVY